MSFFTLILKRWKKYATLLPSNWLVETPETFTSRGLGRQTAERERISGIDWNEILRKNRRLDIPNQVYEVILEVFYINP
ncbi:hypothetical protein [Peribacillus frigoritolerans]|uniref:hypothetical protein n=1 Tax=Peribacillus frigoritolerans TaxID=450367 RepID=UPI00215B58D1|nr:hypothetical protein [Peribacillus frigoritolerans]MCR8867874.1 hypothetical protein [Peribacillus frigoritolerans]